MNPASNTELAAVLSLRLQDDPDYVPDDEDDDDEDDLDEDGDDEDEDDEDEDVETWQVRHTPTPL